MNEKCGITDETLVDYVYDEIEDAAKRKEVEEHIKTCAECGAGVKELELVKKTAENADVDFSDDIWDVHRQGVLRKLAKKEKPMRNFREVFNVKTFALAAIILLMSGVGLQLYRSFQATQEQQVIADKADLLQNIDIIERLDFYEEISNI